MRQNETRSASGRTMTRRRASVALLLAFSMLFSLLLGTALQSPVFAALYDEDGDEVFCGQVAHKHGEACYTTKRTLICGQEETGHHHSDACYTEKTSLICGEIEREEHHHSDACWSERQVLACGKTECAPHHHSDACMVEKTVQVCTETDPEHVHGEECYTTQTVIGCGLEETDGHSHLADCYTTESFLSCGLEETDGHTHTDACYLTERVLSCGKEEKEGHIHSDACWKEERILSCGLSEHEHTLECYSDRSAVENEADWRASVSGAMITGRWDKDLIAVARTQIGYTPNTRNYIVYRGNKFYYTRYGDWIDDSEYVVYGDWCASFVAFCMYYAGIRNVPYNSNCAIWVEKLIDADMYFDYDQIEPRPGDLMFIYSGREEDAKAHKAIHMGIVAEVTDHSIITIEGNVGSVSWREYQVDETNQILGFGRLPENPKYRSITGSLGRITYSGVLPEGAQAVVQPFPAEDLENYDKLPEGRVLFAFETKYLVDGQERKPGAAVQVRIETGKLPEGEIEVYHIRQDDKGVVTEFWPVEALEIEDDALSYITFTLSRCVAVVTEPES